MRIVFLGRRNFVNHCFANWLAARHHVVAFFAADARRYTTAHRLRWIAGRVRRGGVLRAIDQSLYQLYYDVFELRTNRRLKREAFAAAFGPEAFALRPDVPVHAFGDLNGDEAVSALETLAPDLVFAVCISQYLRAAYERVPRFGTVLYHEGVTPEYKGLHTAFWANLRGEAHRIGYTLLQLTAAIDGGRPLAQGAGRIDPRLARWWNYAGHQALIDGLPSVERALAALEAGEPPRVTTSGGASRMWSYPGLSDEVRRAWRARRGG